MIYYTTDFRGGTKESHRLLEEAIGEYTGDSRQARKLTEGMYTGEKGKPYIDGFEYFSISHTDSVWAVLVSERECGLDIQHAKRCRAVSIAKRFYHPEDACRVTSLYDEDPDKGEDEFFRIWARREALVKAEGGSVADSDIPSVSCDQVDLKGTPFRISDIRIPDMPDIYAAVCVRGEAPAAAAVFKKI